MAFQIDPEQIRILGHVTLSMILGGVIGIDREMARKAAGLRTHMFVAGAATLFVSLGSSLVGFFSADQNAGLIRSDPIRIIEAVITGVSFLGAGTIIRNSSEGVIGLTTAASLLFSAAVGICVALSQFVLSAGIVLIAIAILRSLAKIERGWLK